MANNYLYYKLEPNERPWELIPDTPQAHSIARKQGAMFTTWASLSEPYKDNGQPEPVRFGDLPLDFDHKDDPGQALKDVQSLLFHLIELYEIDPYSVQYFLSGSKGFHVVMPAELMGAAGDPYLPLAYKKMATGWKEKFDLKTLDLSLYCMGKGKMFRIPNVRRANSRYKVPITLEEIQTLSIGELEALSESPREIEPVDFDLAPAPDLAALFQQCQDEVYKEKKRQESMPEMVNNLLSKETPPCIKYLIRAPKDRKNHL